MKVTNNAPTPQQLIENTKTSQTKDAGTASAKNRADQAGRSAGANSGASIEISEQAKLMKQATDAVKNSPDTRSERVQSLKQSIKDGTYHVSADKIADKLVDEHLGTSFGKNNL